MQTNIRILPTHAPCLTVMFEPLIFHGTICSLAVIVTMHFCIFKEYFLCYVVIVCSFLRYSHVVNGLCRFPSCHYMMNKLKMISCLSKLFNKSVPKLLLRTQGAFEMTPQSDSGRTLEHDH